MRNFINATIALMIACRDYAGNVGVDMDEVRRIASQSPRLFARGPLATGWKHHVEPVSHRALSWCSCTQLQAPCHLQQQLRLLPSLA